jgi:hypothetical protein
VACLKFQNCVWTAYYFSLMSPSQKNGILYYMGARHPPPSSKHPFSSLFSRQGEKQRELQNSTLPGIRYRGFDKSLARPTSRCILFDGENISFDASLVTYSINSTNIGLRTYQHPCISETVEGVKNCCTRRHEGTKNRSFIVQCPYVVCGKLEAPARGSIHCITKRNDNTAVISALDVCLEYVTR